MKITLPIPVAKLWPNNRVHWRERTKLVKAARSLAHMTTLVAAGQSLAYDLETAYLQIRSYTGYTLAFFYKDARRRDDDNAAASCKAYRDGIADAIGVDDNTLRLLEIPTFQIDRANPRVEITLISQPTPTT